MEANRPRLFWRRTDGNGCGVGDWEERQRQEELMAWGTAKPKDTPWGLYFTLGEAAGFPGGACPSALELSELCPAQSAPLFSLFV